MFNLNFTILQKYTDSFLHNYPPFAFSKTLKTTVRLLSVHTVLRMYMLCITMIPVMRMH